MYIHTHCTCVLPVIDLREIECEFGARYLAKERFFDSLISIFRHYILHKPVVNVCSE